MAKRTAQEHNRIWLSQVESASNEMNASVIFAVAVRPDGKMQIYNSTDFDKVALAKELVSIAFKLGKK